MKDDANDAFGGALYQFIWQKCSACVEQLDKVVKLVKVIWCGLLSQYGCLEALAGAMVELMVWMGVGQKFGVAVGLRVGPEGPHEEYI